MGEAGAGPAAGRAAGGSAGGPAGGPARAVEMVLLDRDGVLNQDRADYVKHPDEVVLIPGAAGAVARLNMAGIPAVVVTNQSAVGRGIIDDSALERIHERLRAALAERGARLDAILFCPDSPDRPSARRKPAPGMLREALARFGAAAQHAPMIGDSLRDLEAAAAVGCPRILVRTGKGRATEAASLPAQVRPVAVYDDLAAAVAALLGGAQ